MNWLKNIGYLVILIFGIASCQAPTTGTEMYDGDPETQDPVPDDMKEKAESLSKGEGN